jgi:repressor LexA
MNEITLTRRQFQVLEFVQGFRNRLGYSPTIREIAGGLGVSSVATVAEHLDSLQGEALIRRKRDRARSVLLTDRGHSLLEGRDTEAVPGAVIPLLGSIAAGEPIEAIVLPEEVEVPQAMTADRSCYALRVKGESMLGEGILDGDLVVLEQRSAPENGETVVALIDGSEATLKKFYRESAGGRPRIRLQPANPDMEPLIVDEGERIEIQGTVRGLIRLL